MSVGGAVRVGNGDVGVCVGGGICVSVPLGAGVSVDTGMSAGLDVGVGVVLTDVGVGVVFNVPSKQAAVKTKRIALIAATLIGESRCFLLRFGEHAGRRHRLLSSRSAE